ncbi:hypothetical protein [Vagococcus teuberi]
MTNFTNNKNKEEQTLKLNAIVLLFAVVLLSLCVVCYFIGLFANPSLENFFADVSSILFTGSVATGILYLVKIVFDSLIRSAKK